MHLNAPQPQMIATPPVCPPVSSAGGDLRLFPILLLCTQAAIPVRIRPKTDALGPAKSSYVPFSRAKTIQNFHRRITPLFGLNFVLPQRLDFAAQNQSTGKHSPAITRSLN